MPTPERLSLRQARRLALAAQGLAGERPDRPINRRDVRGLARRLGVIQIDSVNVLTRTHYLPGFSRLGAYDRGLLEAEAWGKRPSLFEYWGHEASFMPVELQPLFRWRMERARGGETWTGLANFARQRSDYIAQVLHRITAEGPLTGGDFAEAPNQPGWWNWSNGKRALEWLFWAGHITTRTRRGFERVYDLTERVLPAEVLAAPTPAPEEAHRALVLIAARAMGVATEADLRDYYRLPLEASRNAVRELVEAGELTPVTVEGWSKPAFVAGPVTIPRRGAAPRLLSPFDNLIWSRERTERLFGARIRLEIYTPAHKRVHGYYVLPLLVGDAIVARVDLKADRQSGALKVQAAHLEPGADPGAAAEALAGELGLMRDWLDLSRVAVRDRGDLAPHLEAATIRITE